MFPCNRSGSLAFAQEPKPIDFSDGKEPKDPFSTKVEVKDIRNGRHVATFVNVHANYVAQSKPPRGPYRIYQLKIEHVGGAVAVGSVITDNDGKKWEVFASGVAPKKYVTAQATPLDAPKKSKKP